LGGGCFFDPLSPSHPSRLEGEDRGTQFTRRDAIRCLDSWIQYLKIKPAAVPSGIHTHLSPSTPDVSPPLPNSFPLPGAGGNPFGSLRSPGKHPAARRSSVPSSSPPYASFRHAHRRPTDHFFSVLWIKKSYFPFFFFFFVECLPSTHGIAGGGERFCRILFFPWENTQIQAKLQTFPTFSRISTKYLQFSKGISTFLPEPRQIFKENRKLMAAAKIVCPDVVV